MGGLCSIRVAVEECIQTA